MGFLTIYYEKVSLENYSNKLSSVTFYDSLKPFIYSRCEGITGKQISFI